MKGREFYPSGKGRPSLLRPPVTVSITFPWPIWTLCFATPVT